MADSILDRIQADPEFAKLSPKGKRVFLRDYLSRDADYRKLSSEGQAQFANEIYGRYPDQGKRAQTAATSASASASRAVPAKPAKAETVGSLDFGGAPTFIQEVAAKTQRKPAVGERPVGKPKAGELDLRPPVSQSDELRKSANRQPKKPIILKPNKTSISPQTGGYRAARMGQQALEAVSAPFQKMDEIVSRALLESGVGTEEALQNYRAAQAADPFRGVANLSGQSFVGNLDPELMRELSGNDTFSGLARFGLNMLAPSNFLPVGGAVGAMTKAPKASKALAAVFGVPAVATGAQQMMQGGAGNITEGLLNTIAGGIGLAHAGKKTPQPAKQIERGPVAPDINQALSLALQRLRNAPQGETLPTPARPAGAVLQNPAKTALEPTVVAEKDNKAVFGNPRIAEVDPRALALDPERFQFKGETNAKGVTNKLRKVETYDPDLGGVLAVWRDPADGKDYVVNGHHRQELALRTNAPTVAVRYIDAPDAATARYKGALINIAEGQGTALDAAKIFREKQATPEILNRMGVSSTGKVANDGLALASLDDFLFRQVASGALPESRGVAIGRYEPDPVRQRALFALIERAEKRGRRVSDGDIQDIAHEARSAPIVSQNADNLFGEEGAFNESLALDKAELARGIREELAKDKALFGKLANEKRAEELRRGQNEINVEENARIAGESSVLAERFDRARRLNAPTIDAALNEAAIAIANGAKKPDVKQKLLAIVKERLQSLPEADAPGAGGVLPGRDGNPSGDTDLFSGEESPKAAPSVQPTTPAETTPAQVETGIVSTPRTEAKPAVIRAEPHPLRQGATVYRAYAPDGTPLYMGGDTMQEVQQKLSASGYRAETAPLPDPLPSSPDKPISIEGAKPQAVPPLAEPPQNIPENIPPSATPVNKAEQAEKASPAASDMSRMRMRDIESFAAEQSIPLEDKATFRETHRQVIERALGDYDDILHSLRQYDPKQNPQATPEERYVAAYRQREIKGELDGAIKEGNAAKVDALLSESQRLSSMLYRTGSEAGRSLQFQQVLIGDKLDVNSVLQRAEGLTEGKLSNPARRSLITLADDAEKAKASIDADLKVKAEEAKGQVRTRQNKSAKGAPEGIKEKLVAKLTMEEQQQLSALTSKLREKTNRASSALPGAQFVEALPELTQIGVLYAKAVSRSFREWAAGMRSEVADLDDGQMETLWAHVRDTMRQEKPAPSQFTPESFVDRLAQKLGREGSIEFLNAIDDGERTILNKLLAGEELSATEKATVQSAWKQNSVTRRTRQETGAAKAVSDIIREARTYKAPPPKPMTAETLQERARRTLAELGKPATPRAKPTVPEALMAEWEYAKGARDLNTFARRIQAEMGGKMEQKEIDALFAEAVKRYTQDYKQLDGIKEQMAKVIRQERYRLKNPFQKTLHWASEAQNAAKSLKSTLDLSGWLRQGGIMAISRPKIGGQGFRKMLAAAKDESVAKSINESILNGPNGELYKSAGLDLVDQSDNAADWKRDEDFVSRIIGKIPGFGKLHQASERAYVTVGNVMRAGLFDTLYEPGMTEAEARDLARYINVVSGRADLNPQWAMAMPAIAKGIWSPRYAISRIQYLLPLSPGNPLSEASTWRTRKIIAQEYGRYVYKIALVGFLAQRAGAEVELDPRSSDFMTIRMGRLEVDPTSGLKQYIRLAGQLLSGEKKVAATGREKAKIQGNDAAGNVGRFTRGKLDPAVGLAWDLLTPNAKGERTDPTGEVYTPGKVVISALLPISVNNVIEGMLKFGVNETTARDLAASILLDLFGVSTNVRDRDAEAKQEKKESAQKKRNERRTTERR